MSLDIGPVQLIVFGFDKPRVDGTIAAELNRLRDRDIVRVIDALVVRKDAAGNVTTMQATALGLDEAEQLGAVLGGLLGLGAAGPQGMEPGAQADMEYVREQGGHVFNPDEWDVLDDIPNDSAAALLLLEHRWAVPFRDAVRNQGGAALGDLWLHPQDLIEAGIIGADVAEVLREETRVTGQT